MHCRVFSMKTHNNHANLCVGTCKALHWHLQSFALAHAKLCVGSCNALRWTIHCGASANTQLCVGQYTAVRRPMSDADVMSVAC